MDKAIIIEQKTYYVATLYLFLMMTFDSKRLFAMCLFISLIKKHDSLCFAIITFFSVHLFVIIIFF